ISRRIRRTTRRSTPRSISSAASKRTRLTRRIPRRRSRTRVALSPTEQGGVGAGEERRWHFETERLGGLEIDHQLELRRLLDRQFCRVGPFENFIYASGSSEGELPD